MTPTPSPYPPLTLVDGLVAAAVLVPLIIVYWLPTIVATWRRNSRMGLVVLYNLLGFLLVPWFHAWIVVLGEHSRHQHSEKHSSAVWTPTTPEQTDAILPPPQLPPNVTQLRPAGESQHAKAQRLMREWGRK